MDRRGFLAGCLAASTAPAFVKADNLMGLLVPRRGFETMPAVRLPNVVYGFGEVWAQEYICDDLYDQICCERSKVLARSMRKTMDDMTKQAFYPS